MNISKIVMGTGALVLTAAGVFAGRASVKATLTNFFVTTAGGVCRQITVGSTVLNFTTGLTGTQATIKTAGNTRTRKLWKNCSNGTGTVAVHFKG